MHILYGDIPLAPFEGADVVPMQPRNFRESFLREALGLSQGPYPRSKSKPDISPTFAFGHAATVPVEHTIRLHTMSVAAVESKS